MKLFIDVRSCPAGLYIAASITFLVSNFAAAEESGSLSARQGGVSGIKSALDESGVVPHVSYFNTLMGNLAGGRDTGGAFKGNLTFGVRSDLEKAVGWHGGQVFVSAVNTHGDSLSGKFVGDTLGTRKDDEPASTHLFEFGLEQRFFSDRFSLKAGQLAATSDFFNSISGLFIHDSLNWGPNGQSSAPGGPDSSMGVRVRFDFTPSAYAMAGVYDNATRGNFGNNEQDEHGTRWAFPHGARAVWIGEVGATFSKSLLGQPAVVRAGLWLDEADRIDFEGNGQSCNWGFYAVAEQTLWSDSSDPSQSVTLFSRFAYADPGQNRFEWQLNSGLIAKGLLPGRDGDSTGLAFTYASTSAGWRNNSSAGNGEAAVEFHHQIAVRSWCRVSLFAQYLPEPGTAGGTPSNDAVVTGIASLFTF